jgi:hypothetical protein
MDDIANGNEKGDTDLTSKSKGQYGEMDDLYTGKASPKMESIGSKSKSGDLGGAKSSGGSSVKMADVKDGLNSKGNALGKIAAGGMDIASMIMKFIGPVIAGMAGIQAITELLQNALKDILKPLNKLFTKLFKALKPIIEILKASLEPFIETVTNVLIDVITPLAPIVESIFECISPILDIVTVLLDAIMVPLLGIFNTIIVPALEIITGSIKAVVGAVMTGFGALKIVLGSILSGVGTVVKWITFGLGHSAGNALKDKGKEMINSGEDLFDNGASYFEEGLKEAKLGFIHLLNPSGDAKEEDPPEQTTEVESYQAKNADVTPGSAMDGLIGNGDIVNNYYYQNMYGSGNSTYNQNSYHNGMNMSQHC